MPISRKAFCFLCAAFLPVLYIFISSFVNPVIATQSISLLLEKKFDNSMFILSSDLFKVERRFKNNSLIERNMGGLENIEGCFQNSHILIADKILSVNSNDISVNSNLLVADITGGLSEFSQNNTVSGAQADNSLASLILVDDNFDNFSSLTSSKLYVARIQSNTYVPAYLRGVDFANYANLHLERGDGEEGVQAFYNSYGMAGEMSYGLTTLLNVDFDNPSITESETSLDMSELEQSSDRLPTKDIFKRFSNFKDMSLVSANEIESFDSGCSFLPEKSAPREFNKFHVVEAKDSVISIAKEYNITVSELMAANNLSSIELNRGSTLLVPEKLSIGSVALNLQPESVSEVQTTGSVKAKISLKGREEQPPSNLTAVSSSTNTFKRLLWPSVSRRITSRYGVRVHPIYRVKKFHNGIDIGAKYGSSIKAASDGVVVYSGWKSFYGRTIIIKHSNDLYTLYAHCSKLISKKGERVSRGAFIAKVGSSGLSTGPHIHFSVQKGGRFVNPMKYF